MTYTTTRTITLPGRALWTQIEAAVREVGGSVGEAGVSRSQGRPPEHPFYLWSADDPVGSLCAICGRESSDDVHAHHCPRCSSPLEPVPDAGMVCVREGCRA